MVTIEYMVAKHRSSARAQAFPNGLADAISRAKEIDPTLGPTKLARMIRENKQTIDRYVKGERKLPIPVAEKLAPLVRASVAELMGIEIDAPNFERVPLLSWVSAGRLTEQDAVGRIDTKENVIACGLPRGHWISLRVKGTSMDRIAPDDSIIFVDISDTKPRDGHFYVFSDDSGAATFKRFKAGKPPKLQPYSTDPDHETTTASEGMKVVGRVRRVQTDL